MKVLVVTDRPEPTTAARRRAVRTVNLLAAGHEVELLSVWDGAVPEIAANATHSALLKETKGGDEPVRPHTLTAEQLRMVAVAPTSGSETDIELSRLAHVELGLALSMSDAEVIVVADAHLTPAVCDVAAASAHVVTLHPGAPVPETLGPLARGDAVVSSTGEAQHLLEGHFGESAPWVVEEPLPVVTADGSASAARSDDAVLVITGTAATPFIALVVEAFLEATASDPSARLHVCIDGEPTGMLRRPISQRGRHGSIVFGPQEAWRTVDGTTAVIVGPSDDDESGEVAVESLSRGLPVVVVGRCVASALDAEPGVQAVADDLASIQGRITELVTQRPEAPARGTTSSDGRASFWDGFLDELARDATPVPGRGERRLAVEAALALPVDPLLLGTPQLRKAEERLAAARPELARWHGRLAEVDDTRLERDIWNANVHDVASVLEQAGVAHILVSDHNEPGRFAVSEQDRSAVVGALAKQLDEEPVYVDLVDDLGETRGTVLASQVDAVADAPVLLVYRSTVTTSRTLVFGPAQGCAIEFWAQDPETEQFLSPPLSPSRRGPTLPSLASNATIVVGERSVPTTSDMLEVTNDDITFPIDFVWTWLDDGDAEWRARRDEHLVAAGGELSDPNVAARFVNRDELKYSMRSAAMYAPWVRHHYVVTDRQTPSWLDADHPDVTVVDHRDIFTDPAALPTFNSHAIECQLHHIPGISEHFVYFNDDFFLGRMLPPTTFFTPVGQANSFQSNAFIPPGPKSDVDRLFFAYRKNDRDLFEKEFGKTLTHGYLHAPYSLRVSLMEELEQKFAEEWNQTMHGRFRSLTDHAFATCLVPAYGVETGQAVHQYIRSRYVRAGSREHQPLMREILTRRHLESFCLNDTGENDLPADEHDTAMAAFMEAYYPVRAPWERAG